MDVFLTILIGLVAAFFSGMFGIGGATTTTPALRVILGTSPGIALGTPLPVVIPTALAGALTYHRSGLLEVETAAYCCLGGVLGSITGALATKFINLHYLMLATGGVVLYVAGITAYRGVTGKLYPADVELAPVDHEGADPPAGSGHPKWLLVTVGLAAGLFSGLLGVGGGVVLVPSFIYVFHLPLKRAFGTSLTVIGVIAIPGTVIHALLGHISWRLFLLLTAGVIPGAFLGARFSIKTGERVLYVLLGIMFAAYGIVFIVNEIIEMTG